MLQRTLDEMEEDIIFICLAELSQQYTELHKEFLEAFWMEEFNHSVVMQSSQKRSMIRRDKIRSCNIRMAGSEDPSTENAALRLLYKAYSGYVHAASPQVMDMCIGDPPHFQLSGITDFYRVRSSYADAWNYFYRGYGAMCMATMAFGIREDVDSLMSFWEHIDFLTNAEY